MYNYLKKFFNYIKLLFTLKTNITHAMSYIKVPYYSIQENIFKQNVYIHDKFIKIPYEIISEEHINMYSKYNKLQELIKKDYQFNGYSLFENMLYNITFYYTTNY